MKKTFTALVPRLAALVLITGAAYLSANLAAASKYGMGFYGECAYQVCGISIATSGTVELDVTPTASGVYTIDGDEVEVTTGSAGGFLLTLESDSDTENGLVGDNGTISAATGDLATPVALANNQWGYRVDGVGGFGAGPTGAATNQPSSSLSFAAVPLLGSADTIRTYTSSALDGEITSVWYGIKADTALTAGQYSATVTYTAIVVP